MVNVNSEQLHLHLIILCQLNSDGYAMKDRKDHCTFNNRKAGLPTKHTLHKSKPETHLYSLQSYFTVISEASPACTHHACFHCSYLARTPSLANKAQGFILKGINPPHMPTITAVSSHILIRGQTKLQVMKETGSSASILVSLEKL